MLVHHNTNEIYHTSNDFLSILGDGMRYVLEDLQILLERISRREAGIPEDIEHCWSYQRLPKYVSMNLNRAFVEKLLFSHITLAYKSFTPTPASLACLAEETLLVWSTEWIIHPDGISGNLSEEIDRFLKIILGKYHGVEQIEAKGILPIGPYHWFTNYEGQSDITHPFTWPEEMITLHPNQNNL